jgi:hypothetical protein
MNVGLTNPIRSVVLALLIAIPSLAAAQTMNFEDAAALLGASCGVDIDVNCRGVNLDPVRLKECITRNQDAVSAKCRADYGRAFEAIQLRVKARSAVAKLCERDAVKFCGGQKESGEVLACLLAGPRGVTVKCTQAISAAGYR